MPIKKFTDKHSQELIKDLYVHKRMYIKHIALQLKCEQRVISRVLKELNIPLRGRAIDITGEKYGRLTAVQPNGVKRWDCICECGNKVNVLTSCLRRGNTKSCGCWARDFCSIIGSSNLINYKFIDWSTKDASYLLGAFHGDGCVVYRNKSRNKKRILSGVDFAVGKKDLEYANLLMGLLESLSLMPKLYEGTNGLSVVLNSKQVAREFEKYKKDGIWFYPNSFLKEDYLAGLIDTDGTVSKKNISISQKYNGNLPKTLSMFKDLNIHVTHCTNDIQYKNKEYLVDHINICSAKSILKVKDIVQLRHYRKTKKLLELCEWATDVMLVKNKPTIEETILDYLKQESVTGIQLSKDLSLPIRKIYNAIKRLKTKNLVASKDQKYILVKTRQYPPSPS